MMPKSFDKVRIACAFDDGAGGVPSKHLNVEEGEEINKFNKLKMEILI